MRPLTVLIPTFNEADNLRALLPLVSWADELLIVDSFSTDDTLELAQKAGARIIQREYGNSASQKNWAIPQAKNEWILLLDADERPSESLTAEIKAIMSQAEDPQGPIAYWMGRDNHFMGQAVRFSGWQNDAVIRFFKRDLCRYEEKEVHAEIITKGKVAWLKGRLLHYTFKSMRHFMAKMERYAHWSAGDYASKTPKVGFFHLYLKPAFRFFKHYIIQQGFRDGKLGFIVCKLLAWGVFMRYVILLEKRGH